MAAQYRVTGPHTAQDGRQVYVVLRSLGAAPAFAVTECPQRSTAEAVAREMNAQARQTELLETSAP